MFRNRFTYADVHPWPGTAGATTGPLECLGAVQREITGYFSTLGNQFKPRFVGKQLEPTGAAGFPNLPFWNVEILNDCFHGCCLRKKKLRSFCITKKVAFWVCFVIVLTVVVGPNLGYEGFPMKRCSERSLSRAFGWFHFFEMDVKFFRKLKPPRLGGVKHRSNGTTFRMKKLGKLGKTRFLHSRYGSLDGRRKNYHHFLTFLNRWRGGCVSGWKWWVVRTHGL